jgi:hypothetical protein
MFWVTRAGARVDRVACPWLIKRFIDKEAQFLYVAPERVLPTAAAVQGRSFDATGADYGHRGGLCTFEVLVQEFGLGADAALGKLARIVHAADIQGEIGVAPEGAGLFAFSEGLHAAVADDHRKLALAAPLYDALYVYCGGNP